MEKKINNKTDNTLLECALAGLYGGIVSGFISAPLEHGRIRM